MFAEFSLVEFSVLSAGCIPGDMLWSWGIVLSSSNLLLLSLFLFILCCPSSYSCLLPWFLFFYCLFVWLYYPALLYVIRVPHTFPPCEIIGGSMGSFGCKLYLVVYLFACFIESNNVLCQVSFIYLLCSVSFLIHFHAQCSIHNANLFSAVYQAPGTKPAPNYLSHATCTGSPLALL